jgi:Fe-S cluster assembly protein SufD
MENNDMTLHSENTVTGQDTLDSQADAIGIFSREGIERLSRSGNEPVWMLEKRLRAWTAYREMSGESTPSPVSKRLDVSQMNLERLRGPLSFDVGSVPKETHISSRSPGVISSTLPEALKDYPDLIEKYFMTECVRINENAFTALHAAFWNAGTFLYVPKGVKIDVPIEDVILKETGKDLLFPHTLIVAEEGAMVTFIETSRSAMEEHQAFFNGVVEIYAGAGATVNYISPQFLGENVYHFTFKKAIGKKDSTIHWYEIGIGGGISQSDIQLILDGEGASGELLGIYFPRGHQQMEYRTLQVHASPNTKSNLLYKGALQEKSKTIFHGVIQVHKGAQRTDAYQANKNILLSSGAHADSIPVLEIEANDVRCTHGATVGPIDEEVLYYLMSRGLSRSESTRMLVMGFLIPVIDMIPVTAMREEIHGYIESRIR